MLSRAQRELGLDAETLCIDGNKFQYRSDKQYLGLDISDLSSLARLGASNYDLFHFYFRPFFFKKVTLGFPTALDLLALKAAGKRIVFYFMGSEVRFHSAFREFSPYHYVDEAPSNVANFPEEAQRHMLAVVDAIADRIVVSDEEMASYVPGYSIIRRALDLERWPFVGPRRERRPLIVHAPSRRIVKGTDFVEAAIGQLRGEGLEFEFRLVENLPQREAAAIYADSDIVIDQVRIGWYGFLSVEAMALGKAVVAYIRDDLREALGEGPPPLMIANPDNLREALRTLITSPEARKDLGIRGRRYVENMHDHRRVAAQFMDLYQDAIDNPKPLDMVPVANLLLRQSAVATQQLGKLQKTLASLKAKVETR